MLQKLLKLKKKLLKMRIKNKIILTSFSVICFLGVLLMKIEESHIKMQIKYIESLGGVVDWKEYRLKGVDILDIKHADFVMLNSKRFNDLKKINKLENLVYLDISNSSCNNLSAIGSFPYLKTLFLDGTDIKDFLNLKDLSKLEELSVSSSIHTLDSFFQIQSLKHLALDLKGDFFLDKLPKNLKLKSLRLTGTVHDLGGIQSLKNLEKLDLDLNYNSKASLTPLYNMSKLKVLNVSSVLFNTKQINLLSKELPQLKINFEAESTESVSHDFPELDLE